jgi:hypothetical protein
MAPVHCAAGSDGDTNFGVTSLAAPNAASSSLARYSLVARRARQAPCSTVSRELIVAYLHPQQSALVFASNRGASRNCPLSLTKREASVRKRPTSGVGRPSECSPPENSSSYDGAQRDGVYLASFPAWARSRWPIGSQRPCSNVLLPPYCRVYGEQLSALCDFGSGSSVRRAHCFDYATFAE